MLSLLEPQARVLQPYRQAPALAPELDGDVRAAYFRQGANGLYGRVGLLLDLAWQLAAGDPDN